MLLQGNDQITGAAWQVECADHRRINDLLKEFKSRTFGGALFTAQQQYGMGDARDEATYQPT